MQYFCPINPLAVGRCETNVWAPCIWCAVYDVNVCLCSPEAAGVLWPDTAELTCLPLWWCRSFHWCCPPSPHTSAQNAQSEHSQELKDREKMRVLHYIFTSIFSSVFFICCCVGDQLTKASEAAIQPNLFFQRVDDTFVLSCTQWIFGYLRHN